MAGQPPQLLMGVADTAKAFGVSEQTVRNWIERGVLDAVQPGGPRSKYLVRVSSVRKLLRGSAATPGGSERREER